MFVFMTSFKDGISIEDRLVSLESKVSSLEKENKDLKDRVLSLEKYININDKNAEPGSKYCWQHNK